MQKAIIYLHGFNSASLDLNGNLLTSKQKLLVMQEFCQEKAIDFFTPNVDYRDFHQLVEDMLAQWRQYREQGLETLFMGSSMGGFASEYLAMKTGAKAIMINPAINPSKLLTHFIGVTENPETSQPYSWHLQHCAQYRPFQQELADYPHPIARTILLDMADELLDAQQTIARYQAIAKIVSFAGGSHSFEHMREALPEVEHAIFCDAPMAPE